MKASSIEKFLRYRYFLSILIVVFYFTYKSWIYNQDYYLDFLPLIISAVFLLIVNRWLYGILILVNVIVFSGQLKYLIENCLEKFSTNIFADSFYWLIATPAFHWSIIFWTLQIGLIIYLAIIEIVFYKNRSNLG